MGAAQDRETRRMVLVQLPGCIRYEAWGGIGLEEQIDEDDMKLLRRMEEDLRAMRDRLRERVTAISTGEVEE